MGLLNLPSLLLSSSLPLLLIQVPGGTFLLLGQGRFIMWEIANSISSASALHPPLTPAVNYSAVVDITFGANVL